MKIINLNKKNDIYIYIYTHLHKFSKVQKKLNALL